MLAGKLNSVLDAFKTKYPALIGVDISSTAIKLVELAEAGKGAYRLERYAIEPLVRDVVTDGNIANLDLVADALKRAHKRLGSRNQQHRARPAGGDGHHQEDHRSVRAKGGRAGTAGRGRGEPVHPVCARRGQSRLPDRRSGAEQSRGVRGADRGLPQGKGRGSGRGRGGRRPEAAGDGHRVLRDAAGVRADFTDAAGERARPEHRAGGHRCACDAFLRVAQQPVPLLPATRRSAAISSPTTSSGRSI